MHILKVRQGEGRIGISSCHVFDGLHIVRSDRPLRPRHRQAGNGVHGEWLRRRFRRVRFQPTLHQVGHGLTEAAAGVPCQTQRDAVQIVWKIDRGSHLRIMMRRFASVNADSQAILSEMVTDGSGLPRRMSVASGTRRSP